MLSRMKCLPPYWFPLKYEVILSPGNPVKLFMAGSTVLVHLVEMPKVRTAPTLALMPLPMEDLVAMISLTPSIASSARHSERNAC